MASDIITATVGAIVTAIGTLIVDIVTYALTKKKDGEAELYTREKDGEAELRQAKMQSYDGLVSSLTELVQSYGKSTDSAKFVSAYYAAGAYASKDVLNACHNLLDRLGHH